MMTCTRIMMMFERLQTCSMIHRETPSAKRPRTSLSAVLIIVCLAGTPVFSMISEQDTCRTHAVRWCRAVHASGDVLRPAGFIRTISDALFGSEPDDLVRPIAVYAPDTMRYWILDQELGTMMVFDVEDNAIHQVQGPGNNRFPSLVGLCGGSRDEVYFTDSRLDAVFRCSYPDCAAERINDTLQMKQPTGIAFAPLSAQLWIVETAAHRVTVMDRRGRLIRRFGNRGSAPGEFNYPTFIWIDREEQVYIVDAMNHRIQMFSSDGVFISSFGQQGDATGYFASPKGLATDSHGNIYVVDGLFHTVQIFDREGRYLSRFGTQGTKDGQCWLPVGISIDDHDRIYLADSYNARIDVFALTHRGGHEE
jgi:DNA-binding beta-propeller fold protein YncE